MPKKSHVPAYCQHKATGQARVVINGQTIYLGKYGSPESRDRYARELAEAGAELPPTTKDAPILVVELCASYLIWAENYYRKDGKPTGSIERVKVACRVLRQLYGELEARDVGPLKLQAIQAHMVAGGKTRRYINHVVQQVARIFRWGVSQELLPAGVYEALRAVPGLKRGRTEAREPSRIMPVSEETIQATLPELPEIVADMVRLQRRTGCRPDEVCGLRPIDVDRSGDVWVYRPQSHKTEWHGHERVILIGPKGQDVLRKYLFRPAESFCFSPAESLEKVIAERRANRKSPMTPSQLTRKRKARPARAPADRYTANTYRQAIHRAVERVNKREEEKVPAGKTFPLWAPNQLRHAAGTEVRKLYGLDVAQVVLGHSSLAVSQVYAEKNVAAAVKVMREIG